MELVRRHGYMKLSIHDDIESLDPETSGRRQRTGRRSRNASAFETSNYRESSANQRGTSSNASGRSMSPELSHRVDFYHPDLDIFDSHGWWVSSAVARQNRGRGTPSQSGTNRNRSWDNANQRGTNNNQRWTYANQITRGTYANQIARGTNTSQRGANANQREANANQRGMNTNQRGTNTNQRGTNANRSGTNTNQRGANANQSGTNMNQRRANANQRGANANQSGTNMNQRGTNANQSGTNMNQRGTNANQSGTNMNQRGANANQRRANANQRGMNANQSGTNMNQRGTSANQFVVNAAQRGTNANQRGTSTNQFVVNAAQRGTNANQRGMNADQRGTNANQRATTANQRGIFAFLRGDQRGANANQPEQTPPRQANQRGTSQGSRSSGCSLTANRGGLALHWRGESAIRGRTSSSQRGMDVNRGRSVMERRTPGQQREASPRRPNYLSKKPWSFKLRQPKVQEESPWRTSVSDSALDQAKDNLAHQQGSTAHQRWTRAAQRRTPVDQRRSPADHRRSPASQRGSPGSQRRSPDSQRRSPDSQRRSPDSQRRSPASQRRSPDSRRGSPDSQRGSPASQRRSPASQRGSPASQRGSPGFQRRCPDCQSVCPGSQRGSPGSQRGSPLKKRGPTADEQEISEQSVTRWSSRISALRNKPKSKEDRDGLDPDSLMFRDGERRIDMVIAFTQEVGPDGEVTEAEARRRRRRRVYQANLIKEGLELELEHNSLSFNGKIWFLKVHIPWATQLRIAGVIGLKLPTRKLISISVKTLSDQKIAKYQKKWYVKWRQRFYEIFEPTHFKPEPSFYMNNKIYRREEQFLVKDRHTQFSPAQRSQLVMQILIRAKYEDELNQFGINRLLAAETYSACFPLHEGEYYKSNPDGTYTDRQLLYLEWAQVSKWYKRQPLWLVQRYFGDQIGLYYAWLGFYTKMLIPPAIVGSMCFLYGILSKDSGDNIPSKEICDANGVGNVTLCPMCDKACSYQKMYEACIFAQMTYLIDNPATVFFAIFMCFWATTFLVLWKREESVYKWQWDLAGTDPDENPRPEYEASVTATRINPVTGTKEPFRSPWHNFIRRLAVSSVVFMMIAISMGAVLGVITYRIAMVAVIYRGSGGFLRAYARLFTILSAAVINLTVSEILIKIFTEVALVITNLENPRTQTDYEDSVTFKMFIFEFINFYATIVYIAFFKGSFYDHPGDKEARKSPFLTIKGDICFQAGCLSELCIMLGVSMIGKQTCHNIKEMGLPAIKNLWRSHSHRSQTLDPSKPYTAWEKDYHLQDPGHMALYEEYLEMIMQYGFVTLFVAAFPLGPLVALINNICEIRMDAYKMVTQARRPLAERVEDIGAWYGLLRFLTYLAVVTNGFVIAYTSDFIPRMVYKYVYSPDHTLEGYVNYSLSWFNTSDFQTDWGADDNEWDPPMCAYRGYRNPPDHPKPYGLSPYYWHVFAARLSFIVLFEHLVFTLTQVINAIIPKVPTELVRQIKREHMLEKELKYERNQNATDVEFLKAMAEGKGLQTVRSGDASVTIHWKDNPASGSRALRFDDEDMM